MKKHTLMILTGVLVLAFSLSAAAVIPMMINYQGYVTDVSGTPIEGNGFLKLAIVNQAGDATYWSNDGTSVDGGEPTNAVAVTVTNGIFSIKLGDTGRANMGALPATPFDNQEIYIRVWFSENNITFEQLEPDIQVVSSAFAYKAQSVAGGLSWTQLADIPAGFNDGTDDGITSESDPTITDDSVKDGVSWSELSGIPAGFADGVDDEGAGGAETDPTVLASVKDGVSWSELSGIPAGFADGTDEGLTSESDPQVGTLVNGKWCTSNGLSVNCSSDAPAVAESTVESYIANDVSTSRVPRDNGSKLVSGTIYDNGTNVAIGTSSINARFHVSVSDTNNCLLSENNYNSSVAKGVFGYSEYGYGVYGNSNSGYGGYFKGNNDHNDLQLGGSIGRINTDISIASSDMIISSNDDIQVRLDNDSGEEGVFTIVNSGGNALFYVDESANVGINDSAPAYRLEVNGDINTVLGGYRDSGTCVAGTCSSDRKLKKNIVPLQNALDKIDRLEPVNFEFNDPKLGIGKQYGLVAQDVEKFFPEWVVDDQEGYKKIKYGLQFQMLLIQSVKEQQATISKLNTRLDELENIKQAEIDALKDQLAQLRSLVETVVAQQNNSANSNYLLTKN